VCRVTTRNVSNSRNQTSHSVLFSSTIWKMYTLTMRQVWTGPSHKNRKRQLAKLASLGVVGNLLPYYPLHILLLTLTNITPPSSSHYLFALILRQTSILCRLPRKLLPPLLYLQPLLLRVGYGRNQYPPPHNPPSIHCRIWRIYRHSRVVPTRSSRAPAYLPPLGSATLVIAWKPMENIAFCQQ
jgi:hypothetical protein